MESDSESDVRPQLALNEPPTAAVAAPLPPAPPHLQPVTVYRVGSDYLVFDRTDIKRLIRWMRLNGSFAGIPKTARESAGPPLLLSPAEVICGLETGTVTLHCADGSDAEPVSPRSIYNALDGEQERIRVVVFRHFWHRGYWLTLGTKFGSDFLLYNRPPALAHASHIVLCFAPGERIPALDFVSFTRLATTVRKHGYIVQVQSLDADSVFGGGGLPSADNVRIFELFWTGWEGDSSIVLEDVMQ